MNAIVPEVKHVQSVDESALKGLEKELGFTVV